MRRYQEICASVFHTLAGAGIPFIVLKGAALAAVAYPDPLLRHADDIDLLLHEHALNAAAGLLREQGWRGSDQPVLRNPLHVPPLVHASGVPLELHRRLLIPYYTLPYDALWERSVRAPVAGAKVRVLSPADSLVHIAAHAMSGFPILRWVGDAWFILQRPPGIDWSVFASTAMTARLHLPLSIACSYLSEQMRMPIPPPVLADLRPEPNGRVTGAAGPRNRGRKAHPIRCGHAPSHGGSERRGCGGARFRRRFASPFSTTSGLGRCRLTTSTGWCAMPVCGLPESAAADERRGSAAVTTSSSRIVARARPPQADSRGIRDRLRPGGPGLRSAAIGRIVVSGAGHDPMYARQEA